MSVLPLNWPDKVDSPELLAWLQQFGLEKYIDSNQINSIRDALNELYFSSNPDRIISLGTETIDGNEHTYEDYTWQLGGVQVNNIGNPSIIVIPSATVGFKRKDISVFTPAGTIERVAGTETDGEVVTSPDVPEGTLYYKSYDIDGDTIGVDPEPPAIDGSIYKKKIENTRWKSTQSGANVVIPFQAAGQSHYSVVHSGLISVAGFSTAALTTPMYEGQDVLFENQTGNPITLKNMFSGVNAPFDLGADLVVPNEGKIWFRSRNGLLELIMKSWSGSNTFIFSQRNVRLSSTLTAGNWYGFIVNSNFAVSNFATNFGASILSIADSTLRSMNGIVIDGINIKKLNHVIFTQPLTELGIDFEIEIWKYDFQQNVSNASALNLRKVIAFHQVGSNNYLTGKIDKVVSTDAIDTPASHLSKYIIFLKTNGGTYFIFLAIDWNFQT